LSNSNNRVTLENVLELIGKRKLAKIPGSASVASAIAQLRNDDYEVLPIDPIDNERPLVFSGYSVISKLLETEPSEYGTFLKSPCLLYCLSGGTVSKESDLLSLLHVFESTMFGFALIHDKANKIFAKITVNDLLTLFQHGMLSSKLLVKDVESAPMFSISKGAKIIDCLREMESREFRKVKIAGTSSVITDRLILSHLFDEKRLQRVSKIPQHLLDDTLEDLESIQGKWIDGRKNLSEAAESMTRANHGFLLTDNGIITPWDLIIKPWRLGDLRISNKSSS